MVLYLESELDSRLRLLWLWATSLSFIHRVISKGICGSSLLRLYDSISLRSEPGLMSE